jgi:hypothetical protein
VAVLGAGKTHAQVEDANGAVEFWSRMNLRWTTQKSIQHDFEFQYRNQQRVSSLPERFQLYTFRWYIQKRWKSFYIQSSPVTFFERLTSEGDLVNEYRLTQHVGWFLNEQVQLRSGVEGRFFWSEGTHFEEVRWRSRLQYLIPIRSQLKIQFSDEVFFHERLSGNEVPFFDQNRVSAGMNYQLTKKWSVESGYQFHVRTFTQGQVDRFHVFYTYVTYQL